MKALKAVLFTALLFGSRLALAGDITAASCSDTDVQAANNNAGLTNGGTLWIPNGSCTWTAQVVISKNVTVTGSGSTTITLNVSSGSNLGVDGGFSLGATSSRVTNMTIDFLAVTGSTVGLTSKGQNVRIDHITFLNSGVGTTPNPAVFFYGGTGIAHPTALVDHCSFTNHRVLIQGDRAVIPSQASELWQDASKIGAADQSNVVYVEDCTFTRTTVTHNCIDSQYGGRYVFRYNDVTNTGTEAHSVNTNERGARSWEIYNNVFNTSGGLTPTFVIFQRAGTGVVFGNRVGTLPVGSPATNYSTTSLTLDNIRSFATVPTALCCDGSSVWDGNNSGEEGHPCRDQIGRGQDSGAWSDVSPPSQASEPAYFWDNLRLGATFNPSISTAGTVTCSADRRSAHIASGTDYVLGTLGGYSAYTYPHPLNTDSSGYGPVRPVRPVRKLGPVGDLFNYLRTIERWFRHAYLPVDAFVATQMARYRRA